jgi:hypothetical protein
VEDAKTALQVAQAQHDAAQLQLKATKAGGSRSVQAAAAIARAKAEVALAEAQLGHEGGSRYEQPLRAGRQLDLSRTHAKSGGRGP